MAYGRPNNMPSYKVGQAPWEVNNQPTSFKVGEAPWEQQNIKSSTPFETASQGLLAPTVERSSETMGDIKQAGSEIKQSFNKRIVGNFGEIRKALQSGEQGNVRSILQGAGQVAGFLGDTITSGIKGLVKGSLSQENEDKLKETLSSAAKPIVESEPVKNIVNKYEEIKRTNPKLARDIDSAIGFTDFVSNFVGLGAGKVAAETGVKVGTSAIKTGAETAVKTASKVAETYAPKLLSYTSEIPEQAFKTLAERGTAVNKSIKAGVKAEDTLEKTQSAVRSFRKTLSQEWDDSVKGIIEENTGTRFGLSDSFSKKVLSVADEFGIDLPQNLKDISALESINLLKKINELPKLMLSVSPKGAMLRDVKQGLKELSVKAFGGEKGKFAQLYSNYSTKKTVLDAANDIVNAYSNGKPIKMATAQARLEKIFDENKTAYLDAIMDLEKATGQDLLSDIAAGKFTKVLPRTPSIKGGVAEKAFKLLIIPLTSPRATAWIQTNLKKFVGGAEDFVKNPKAGLSVESVRTLSKDALKAREPQINAIRDSIEQTINGLKTSDTKSVGKALMADEILPVLESYKKLSNNKWYNLTDEQFREVSEAMKRAGADI